MGIGNPWMNTSTVRSYVPSDFSYAHLLSLDPRSSSGRILQDIEVNVLMSRKTLAEESEINILEESHTLNRELQHELEDTLHPTEDNEATKELKKSGSDRKQDAPEIKLPSDVVPFSDEWLAALEAAGEEL
ncbi:unnamed protein product [Prunus armeniaca]|uniref:Uncharacterized protein n=1 Tax=Prunus armeniaca TaxID=36596 RepID=A0A6J5XQ69_PRUAR|nr:unnamed protein product [Prunus armeniaca]